MERNDLNTKLIAILEKDAADKREYDENKVRQAEVARLERERLEREAAELERIRLEQVEQAERKRKQEEERFERLRKEEEARLRVEQEEREKELEKEREERDRIEIKPELNEEDSKDSSKFSSEDDMPLLNIIKNRGLLPDTSKVKSPSPTVLEKIDEKPKTRRSLRKLTKDDPGSPSQASSVSSCVSISTLSHKSVSLSCSSMSETTKEEHKCDAKASSSTSTVYDNFDDDDNRDIFKKKKKESESLGNLVHVNIKQEPEINQPESDTAQNKINTSSSSSSSSSDEKTYRAWKKSIMMILNNISCHKHATIFMHPVKDEIAPGYSNLIHRPIDLSTIKKNLENGVIRSTKEFQRDIMLMFTNALMYNSSNHNIHKIALEMFKEVLVDIEQLLNAQEAMGASDNLEMYKPLRCKDMRSSSTASDGKASSILSQMNQDQDEVATLLKKSKIVKNNSKSSLKDENDNSSVKSNSSVSTPRQSNSSARNNSSRSKNQKHTPKIVDKVEKVEATAKKRKPSITTSATNLNSSSSSSNSKEQASNKEREDEQPPKSKRRKSGR